MSPRDRLGDIETMDTLFTAAETEAQRSGEREPGCEHLILAALGLPDGSARRAFERAGADPDQFRVALGAQHANTLAGVGIAAPDDALDGHIPEPQKPASVYRSKGSAQKVFKKVVKLIRKERSQLFGAYIVLAAAGVDHGTTARTLGEMGLDRQDLAAAARAELDLLNQ